MGDHRSADRRSVCRADPLCDTGAASSLPRGGCERHRCRSTAEFSEKRYSGIGWNSLYYSDEEYSYFLRFDVSVQFNHLNPEYNKGRYTPDQRELYLLIKSLNDQGMSYRKISKHLNDEGIPTPENKRWGSSGNSVYSVLKRYREREERLKVRDSRYEPTRSKMWIEYSKVE